MTIDYWNKDVLETEIFNLHDGSLESFEYHISMRHLFLKFCVPENNGEEKVIQALFKDVRYIEIDNHEAYPSIDGNWIYGWELYSIDKINHYKINPQDKSVCVLITFCNLSKLYIIFNEIELCVVPN